jgi:hypothetical protein
MFLSAAGTGGVGVRPPHDESPEWCAESRGPTLTTFDSQFMGVGMHLRTIHKAGVTCTVYEPRTHDRGGRFRAYWSIWGAGSRIPDYDGSEGELYDGREDPAQWHNRWQDPALRRLRDELIAELRARLPAERTPPLPFASPT